MTELNIKRVIASGWHRRHLPGLAPGRRTAFQGGWEPLFCQKGEYLHRRPSRKTIIPTPR